MDQTHEAIDEGSGVALPRWRFGFRLLRVAVMLILAFWLSRNGDAFFYQGF